MVHNKKGFISFAMIVIIVLIALTVGILLIHTFWGGGEGLLNLLIQRLQQV